MRGMLRLHFNESSICAPARKELENIWLRVPGDCGQRRGEGGRCPRPPRPEAVRIDLTGEYRWPGTDRRATRNAWRRISVRRETSVVSYLAISEFPKGRKYLISLSFRGKSSVRPAQVGRFDVNIVIHGSTAVRGRGDLVAYGWALWKLPAPWTHRTRPPHLGKRCAFSTSFHRAFPIKSSTKNPERPQTGSFETSPRCAPPSLRSSNATTSAGASKSWRIARHSKRASNTSYAMPRSANVCPRNRVRYNCLLGPDRAHSPRHRHSGAELVLCQHR